MAYIKGEIVAVGGKEVVLLKRGRVFYRLSFGSLDWMVILQLSLLRGYSIFFRQ